MTQLPDDVALHAAYIDAGSRDIWRLVSDPPQWPAIYEHWIAHIEPSGDLEFWIASSKAGEYFNVYAVLDEPSGTADFELIDELGMSSFFRTHLMPLPTGGCVVTQLASQTPGSSDDDWQARRAALEADLEALATRI